MKVGLIGVGTMGSQMARKLLTNGYEVIAFDINPSALARAQEIGASPARSPRQVAEIASIILLSLPLPNDVEGVVQEAEGVLAGSQPGHVIVDLSTVDPFTTQRNAALAKEKGVGYLDAPVLGRPQACGNWTLPVGGEVVYLDKVRPILEKLAKKIIHVGPSGHGNIIKLLNNMMFGAINAVTAEIMAICAKLGMDPKVLYDTIATSGAASVSNLFIELGPKMINRDFTPLFTIDLLHKDLKLALEMAQRAGVPVIVGHSNQLVNEMARAKGLGNEDTSSAVKVYEEFIGRTISGEVKGGGKK
ncbi:3-hydroxyisobutyrate dehydrogenase [Thermanaeromonas toyohensis ToBE]|uniref:3-hydroxyisobutyrate dehydrogenase n=1 Tax=Thermanaeromonas toyohensis ToBE TaxID=698762 RepID=A0A1W1VV74_9FIRM|nr:NAD(P)-dependent oxidoreductase [Thermanaeromonas toyohensis]SMB97277.1 3-hydroxyisobutyrate dehydrogenase [Thermanaeromonas toyohensis ToBE]